MPDADASLPASPYPGLRAFRRREAPIFCGRAEHRAEVLDRLGEGRFLAVVGASGSGKSSLVLAGLLPDVAEGQLIGVDPETVRFIAIRPGLRPFARLATALGATLKTDLAPEPVLRRGPLGVSQFLDGLNHPPDQALLLVVDQFEEIFRFARLSPEELDRQDSGGERPPLLDGTRNEAQAFVSLLLGSCAQTRHPVYVVLTMRSDYLARCDEFTGLPEAISRSQFLTPRLNRAQLGQAIAGPLGHYAATVAPDLVNRLLNQIAPEQDQLPLLQHALARTWQHARGLAAAEPANGRTGGPCLTTESYLAVGGLAGALDRHANEICAGLAGLPTPISEAQIARFFRALGQHDIPGQPPVRRPVSVRRMAEETGLSLDTVRAVADAFRAEGNHLLMPPVTEWPTLGEEDVLDISHESLLRQWGKLRGWMEDERRQRRTLEQLAGAMKKWERDAAPAAGGAVRRVRRLKEAGDAVATSLYKEAERGLFAPGAVGNGPAWAGRYEVDWARLNRFCREAFFWKKLTSVLSTAGCGLAIMSGLLVMLAGLLWWQMGRAKAEAKAAEAARVAEAKARGESEQLLELTVNQLAAKDTDAKRQTESLTRTLGTTLAGASNLSPDLRQIVLALQREGFVAPPDPVAIQAGPPGGGRTLGAPVLLPLPANAPPPTTLTFLRAPDGWSVLTGAPGVNLTSAWSLTGEAMAPGGLPFESAALVPTPEGDAVVAFGGDGQLHLLTDPSRARTTKLPNGDVVSSARPVRLKGQLLTLFGTRKGSVGFWEGLADATAGRLSLFPTGRPGEITSVDFSPAANAVLATGDRAWLRIWQNAAALVGETSGRAPASLTVDEAKAGAGRAAFSPDGRTVLCFRADTVLLFPSTDTGKREPVTLKHQAPVGLARFSPSGKMLASADADGRIYLWDLADPASPPAPGMGRARGGGEATTEPAVLRGNRGAIVALEWAPDESYLVSAGKDGLTIAWQQPAARLRGDLNGVPLLLPSHPGGVNALAVSPAGDLVATAGADNVARVFPLRPVLRGAYREWGPTSAAGIQGGGDLSLVSEADVYSAAFRDLFLPDQPPHTKGLAYRLNPAALYLNARWDRAFTPRSLLRNLKVRVRRIGPDGKPTGSVVEAQPVDWGPPPGTGKDFDLSPGLRQRLGLGEHDLVEVEIPILAVTSEKGIVAASAQ